MLALSKSLSQVKYLHRNINLTQNPPLKAGRKLNVRKTFSRSPGHLLNVLCAFNLSTVSREVRLLLLKKVCVKVGKR